MKEINYPYLSGAFEAAINNLPFELEIKHIVDKETAEKIQEVITTLVAGVYKRAEEYSKF